jgi:hypothetical protein
VERSFERAKMGICHEASPDRTFPVEVQKKWYKKKREKEKERNV